MNAITVHILDCNLTRRTAVARRTFTCGLHAEIYEGLSELSATRPKSGVLLASDDDEGPRAQDILATMEAEGFFVPVAMYGGQPSPERIVAAMLSGALDYLVWPVDAEALVRSIARLERSGYSLLARRRKEVAARELVGSLTRREREVLDNLVCGASCKDMAQTLGISPRTVEIHRGNMLRKLGNVSSADAVRIGIYAGVDD